MAPAEKARLAPKKLFIFLLLPVKNTIQPPRAADIPAIKVKRNAILTLFMIFTSDFKYIRFQLSTLQWIFRPKMQNLQKVKKILCCKWQKAIAFFMRVIYNDGVTVCQWMLSKCINVENYVDNVDNSGTKSLKKEAERCVCW